MALTILCIRSSSSADKIDCLRFSLVKYYGVSFCSGNDDGSCSLIATCDFAPSFLEKSSYTSLMIGTGIDSNNTGDDGDLILASDVLLWVG
jgi:hypothetical protein